MYKAIAGISAAAFDVYILYDHVVIYKNFLTGGFQFLQTMDWLCVIPAFVGILAAIYGVGLFACKIRTRLFHMTKLNSLLEKLAATLDGFLCTSVENGNEP